MRDSLERVGDVEPPLDVFLRETKAMLGKKFNAPVRDEGGAVFSITGAGFRSIELRIQPKVDAAYVIYAQFSEPEGKTEAKRWWRRGKKASERPWYESIETEGLPIQRGELNEAELLRYIVRETDGRRSAEPIHCVFRLADRYDLYKFIQTLKQVYDFTEKNIGGSRSRDAYTYKRRLGDELLDTGAY